MFHRYPRKTFSPAPYKQFYHITLFFASICLWCLGEFLSLEQNTLPLLHFFGKRITIKTYFTIPFYQIWYVPDLLERLWIFTLIVCFASFPFHSVAYFLEFLETFIKPSPDKHFLNIAWGSATFLHFECVALNYVITVLHLDESSYVSDTLEETNYFDCIICFSFFLFSFFCNYNLIKLGVRFIWKNLFRLNSIFYRIKH